MCWEAKGHGWKRARGDIAGEEARVWLKWEVVPVPDFILGCFQSMQVSMTRRSKLLGRQPPASKLSLLQTSGLVPLHVPSWVINGQMIDDVMEQCI